MPYRYELTWLEKRKCWRKRYRGRTYYLKTRVNGKRDRVGYQAALREWERLKAFLDGLGPSPYTATGAIIPENQVLTSRPVYVPPAPPSKPTSPASVHESRNRVDSLAPQVVLAARPEAPPWIEGVGLHYHQAITTPIGSPYAGEKRIHPLIRFWLDHRLKQAERGELSLKQWGEDRAKLEVFQSFLLANYAGLEFVEQIDAAILNLYRDKQWEFVDCPDAEHRISKTTLKKRLDTVSKWLHWLVDQNILAELPKDLKTYGRVKLDKPKPVFWSVDEVKQLLKLATDRTRLYLLLGLNCGYTQKDIATLEASMIDWDAGIITRDRHKTGVPGKAKLWDTTLSLLREHRNVDKSGPLLADRNGRPLYLERVNDNRATVCNDSIRLSFDRLKKQWIKSALQENPAHAHLFTNLKEHVADRNELIRDAVRKEKRGFKHLRKSAANEIEKSAPHLTSLFLAHRDHRTAKYYVQRDYEHLFQETDKLAPLYGL